MRIGRSGKEYGNAAFTRGALGRILQNRTYVGEISHKGNVYPGEHEAILDRALFNEVDASLSLSRQNHIDGVHAVESSLLISKVWDAQGRRMCPAHTNKRGKRYRYYVGDNRDARLKQTCCRVPAGELEALVVTQLRQQLDKELYLVTATSADNGGAVGQRKLIADHLDRIDVHPDHVDLSFIKASGEAQAISVPASLVRRGNEMRLAIPPTVPTGARKDPALIKLVAKAHLAREALLSSTSQSVAQIAANNGFTRGYFVVLLRIGFLAPDIVAAILDGRQPVQLNRERLARATNLPIGWQQQREMLGFV